MDTPSDDFENKMKIKESLKMEPTYQEKKFLKSQQDVIRKVKQDERVEEKRAEREAVKDLYCMGIKTKLAKGPNPLSMRKKLASDVPREGFPGEICKKKRRQRKGKRSRELSQIKKQD